ncbi:MAG: hypothetical protein JW760_08625 [Spirochaetales bacterium]|nr:hypothetical protein [Spirochaetales bacterium]
MKNREIVFLYCRDPVVSALLITFLSRMDKVTPQIVHFQPGKENVYTAFQRNGLYILDADSFEDPRTLKALLSDLLSTGRRALVLCSFTDPLSLPVHENLLRLDKPFRLQEMGEFVMLSVHHCGPG